MPNSVAQSSPVGKETVTFAEKFCALHRIPPEAYEEQMLRRSLYSPGKLLFLLLNKDANYFAPDREFLRAVGKLTRLHGFSAEVWAFTVNPENSRWHRLRLKMRVSTKKVFQELTTVMHANHAPSASRDSLPERPTKAVDGRAERTLRTASF